MVSHPNRRRKPTETVTDNTTHSGFDIIKHVTAAQFAAMSSHSLFRVDVDKDVLWNDYLASFPTGTNPIFRKRTEHDCSCCRQFIRTVGGVVAVTGEGRVMSLWDVDTGSAVYQPVCDALASLVKDRPITGIFLHTEGRVGTDVNYEAAPAPGAAVQSWSHFCVPVPNALVCRGLDIGPRQSEALATHDVLLRGLTELKVGAIEAVQELIAQNILYRGAEHARSLAAFLRVKQAFDTIEANARDSFAWRMSKDLPTGVARLRNTAIGMLLVDLSEDMAEDAAEDAAVRKYEAAVAPQNYRRPTATVTPSMVEKAKATLDELGLTPALERRYATLRDISVNDILFVDRNVRNVLKTGVEKVFADLPTRTVRPKTGTTDDIPKISIDSFLFYVVPDAGAIEIKLENRLAGSFVSLVAPADAKAPALFKWPNGFSWSYAGDYADSVKERVKAAGGNVEGDVCCRLGWYNYDDLDLHMIEPGRAHIFFGSKLSTMTRGELDVDMNAGGPRSRTPVENIFYPQVGRMREGTYLLYVNQYSRRESIDVGFEVEIDIKGTVTRFHYDKSVQHGANVAVAELISDGKGNVHVQPLLPVAGTGPAVSKQVWGLSTETFHRVNVAMLSPNHWTDGVMSGVGNKHYFFMLEGAKCEGTARGFYNEFLHEGLAPHRKVLEMVGARMRSDETAGPQLSGLGFSSTQRAEVVMRVTDKKTGGVRLLNVTF